MASPQAINPQTINTIVWTFSLALQALLVVAVFGRRIARRLPCFTILILFYPLRSALLFAVIGHIPAGDYGALYSTLSLVDILLQIGFAVEIGFRLIRQPGKLTFAAASTFFSLCWQPRPAPTSPSLCCHITRPSPRTASRLSSPAS